MCKKHVYTTSVNIVWKHWEGLNVVIVYSLTLMHCWSSNCKSQYLHLQNTAYNYYAWLFGVCYCNQISVALCYSISIFGTDNRILVRVWSTPTAVIRTVVHVALSLRLIRPRNIPRCSDSTHWFCMQAWLLHSSQHSCKTLWHMHEDRGVRLHYKDYAYAWVTLWRVKAWVGVGLLYIYFIYNYIRLCARIRHKVISGRTCNFQCWCSFCTIP